MKYNIQGDFNNISIRLSIFTSMEIQRNRPTSKEKKLKSVYCVMHTFILKYNFNEDK